LRSQKTQGVGVVTPKQPAKQLEQAEVPNKKRNGKGTNKGSDPVTVKAVARPRKRAKKIGSGAQ
jgi:hypothetical protein